MLIGYRKLKPVLDKDAYSASAQHIIEYALWVEIFKPLLDILSSGSRQNAASSVFKRALQKGDINYTGDFFFGKFSAAISRELISLGAKFNKTLKAYRLPMAKIPIDIRDLIAQGRMEALRKEDAVNKALVEMGSKKIDVDFKQRADDIVRDLGKQFTKTVTPKDVETPYNVEHFKEAYNENLNLYINDWSSTAIYRLRSKMSEQVAQGFRADETSKIIQAEFGVSKNKAKFLARQETSLLVSAYREQRYTDAGYNEYIWQTSHDERVRSAHKELNGRKFSWNNPPIVDPATGRKAHPGEDFGCRCLAIPVIRIGV
jgi:SPP1 gp7 family putative phage head morphogenesis protein